ncbi:NACHT domain-containing protein, partial [Coleofasciculus sp. LEGE 07081]|uniref:NACHT domain-containing protein n=1 Tax=Coleofasciculus sp. LEGE 07081 TaxID=2777967 RepID=UPI0018828A92
MSLNIRYWLAERHIELAQLKDTQSAKIAGIAFRIAQDMEVKSLNPFAISTLTEVLELPLTAAWEIAPAICQLTVGLLRILSRKKPLRRNEGTWLTFQIAYLNALQGILEQEAHLRRPWMNRAQVPVAPEVSEPLLDSQLTALLKTLRPGRLSDSQAEQALSLVADSFLVQQMNNLAIAWFVANGAEETEARLFTQRLSNGLPGYLLAVIAENPLPLAQLQKFVRLGPGGNWRDTTNEAPDLEPSPVPFTALPLNLHREYYRAKLLQTLSEPLLAEPFSLKELYVPLKGKDVSRQFLGSSANSAPKAVDLMQWVISQLDDKTSIAVIEGDAGYGKTSFCQILAERVARELYPSWMPIKIQLRDITLGQTLEQTLESAFPAGRFTDADGWFSPTSPPCLLILDGLNELPRSPKTERHLWTFIDQVMRFHTQTLSGVGLLRHKILLTSRSAALDTLLTRRSRLNNSLSLSAQLRRIAIAPMGQEEFRQWFQHWAKLQSKSIAQSYFNFLKHGGVFQKPSTNKELVGLARGPLMVYLVGILHRDARVDERIFQMASAEVAFEIYDRMCRWLLGEPAIGSEPLPELIREGLAHASRSLEAIVNLLEGRSPQTLRRIMQVAALTIIQSGQHQGTQEVIESRLLNNAIAGHPLQPLPAFFFRSQQGGSGRAEELGSGG